MLANIVLKKKSKSKTFFGVRNWGNFMRTQLKKAKTTIFREKPEIRSNLANENSNDSYSDGKCFLRWICV
jgi:hypothetical protein